MLFIKGNSARLCRLRSEEEQEPLGEGYINLWAKVIGPWGIPIDGKTYSHTMGKWEGLLFLPSQDYYSPDEGILTHDGKR